MSEFFIWKFSVFGGEIVYVFDLACFRYEHLHVPWYILYKSTAGRYRPVSYPDGPITARYRFIKNAYWVATRTFQQYLSQIKTMEGW